MPRARSRSRKRGSRPLSETTTWAAASGAATAAQLLYESGGAWTAWRRSVDFYDEGTLIWLEADVTIRKLSGGKRSLDDFCTLVVPELQRRGLFRTEYEGRTLREVAAFVSERLASLEGVLSTSTHFMLKTYKRFGVLMHQETSDERLTVTP